MDNTAPMGNKGDLGNGGQQPQPTPISIPQKEQGPGFPQAEFVKPSETEPAIAEELREIGIEQKKEVEPLPEGAEKVGVKLASESAPVITQPTGAIQLPKAEAEAIQAVKTQNNPSNSASWFWLAILRQFRKMHAKLKGV